MTVEELIRTARSCRRFHEERRIDLALLRHLVDMARLGGSARNLQPLRYVVFHDPADNAVIFLHLGWAGYLTDWPGPEAGERPAAYIICLLDTRLCNEAGCDLGIATQNLLLAAAEQGLAGCRIASIGAGLADRLGLAPHYKLLLVIGLGYPKERVILEETREDGDIRYWRDAEGVHHVPKRPLDQILL